MGKIKKSIEKILLAGVLVGGLASCATHSASSGNYYSQTSYNNDPCNTPEYNNQYIDPCERKNRERDWLDTMRITLKEKNPWAIQMQERVYECWVEKCDEKKERETREKTHGQNSVTDADAKSTIKYINELIIETRGGSEGMSIYRKLAKFLIDKCKCDMASAWIDAGDILIYKLDHPRADIKKMEELMNSACLKGKNN